MSVGMSSDIRHGSHVKQPDKHGWIYFIHGWTSVIAEVFDIDIPASGLSFELLSGIALDAT
jgi:hypothetical protein